MDKIAPFLFSGTFASLTRAELTLRHKWRLSVKDRDNIRLFTLLPTKQLCETTGLTESIKACDRVIHHYGTSKEWKLPFELAERMQTLREAIQSELGHRLVLIVKNGREASWQNPSLFGVMVREAFPSAAFDIAEAGNCWVAGRNNAVAFHLMMAAEVGIRCLAEDRKVELKEKNSSKPIEFAHWGEIIREISKKVSDIQQWQDRYKKSEAQQYYQPLLLDLNGFCDGYRNHLFHGRGFQYSDDKTKSLMDHVQRFLSRLSEKIGEGKITPEVW